ncbi:hypothetical protein HNR46_001581 [Haloferula luteola]|uniref:Uncharacterized protein n=1 Tax=Haloferula luteola TaxID=595692 RepID=A0A840V026_9BACT|nr:hypothetical protein [Haloferula luteola]MBB5351345.1 hypothetical protein [Haloferula luteola]
MFPLTEELLIGALIHFVPAGTEVGDPAEAVAIDSKPADLTDYDGYSLGSINRVQHAPAKKEETREASRPEGGYFERKREWVIRDEFTFQTLEYNEIVHQLAFGLATAPTPGTTQKPFEKSFRHLDGWMKIKAIKEDGTELCTFELWVRLRLGDVPEWKNESGMPTYQIEYISSGEAELDGVTFPAAV